MSLTDRVMSHPSCQYLIAMDQSCSWCLRFLCVYPCLLWNGYISCRMTQYIRPVCGHMTSHLLLYRFLRCVFLHLTCLKIQWRRSSGILTVVSFCMWQRRGIANIPHSPTLLCVRTRLCMQRVFGRDTVCMWETGGEGLEETDIVCLINQSN